MRISGRTPTRLQFQTTECGVAALAMILAHFGCDLPLEEVRRATGVSRDSLNAADIARGARTLGLTCKVLRREPKDLPALGFPLIAHLDFIHFVVIEGMTASHVRLNDPACGRFDVPIEKFHEGFTGVVLKLAPGDAFPTSAGQGPGAWRRVLPHLALPLAGAAVCAGLGAFALVAICLSLARLATADPGDTLPWLATAVILRVAAAAIQRSLWSAAQQQLSLGKADALTRHLLGLPQAFFAYRIPDALHKTVYAGDKVAELLCADLLPALTGLAALPVLLAAAWWWDRATAMALGTVTALYGALLLGLFTWRLGWLHRYRLGADSEMSGLAADLEAIESTKIGLRSDGFVVRHVGTDATVRFFRQAYGLAEGLAAIVPRLLELTLIAIIVVRGGEPPFLLGRLVLALGLCLPLRGLLAAQGKLDELRHTLPHIDDVLRCDEPPLDAAGAPSTPLAPLALRADNLRFGYRPHKPPLIDGVGLAVERGEQLGLSGPSGGGKSTLAGLLAGLHRPWSGSVDGFGRIILVDKRPFVFEGTLRDNLCLGEAYGEDELAEVIRQSCLDDVVADRDGGLGARMEPRGRNFSGGQLQRLEIARALLRQPDILILDEATDALDPALERRLRANLRQRGCTLIIVSHRTSTLAACDRVVRIVDGRLATDDTPPASVPSPAATVFAAPIPDEGPECDELDDRLTPALIEAFQTLARHLGVTAVASPADLSGGLQALARCNGIVLRTVRLVVPAWWRLDPGPLLAFTRDGRRPVAILPDGGGRYRLIDPGAGSRSVPLTDAAIAGLRAEAVSLIPPADRRATSTWGLLRSGLARCRRDAARLGGTSLVLAGLAMLLPIAAWQRPGLAAEDVWRLAASLALAVAAIGLLEAARAIAALRLEGGLEAAFVAGLIQKMARVDVAALRRLTPEDIARGVVGVPRLFRRLRGAPLRQALNGATVLAGIGFLSVIDPGHCALVLALTLVAVAVPALAAGVSLDAERRYFRERSVGRRFLADALRSFVRLRGLGAAAWAVSHWRDVYRTEKGLERRLRRQDIVGAGLAEGVLLGGLSALAVLPLAAGSTAASALPAIGVAAWETLTSASGLAAAIAAIMRTLPFVEHLSRLIATASEADGRPPTAHTGTLDVESVGFRYPETAKPVLTDISLRIAPGELVVVAGASGSGKSTLLRLLLGFDRPSHGAVRYNGMPFGQLDLSAWRDRVGAVLQGDRIETAATLRSHVSGLGRFGVEEVWRAVEDAALAADVAGMSMGLQSIVDEFRLTTGQQQRLLIARQLVLRPSLLILDEATNAVSDAMQAELFATFRRLGLACLVATHRESAIAAADRVYVLDQGRLAFAGCPAEFLKREDWRADLKAEEIVRE